MFSGVSESPLPREYWDVLDDRGDNTLIDVIDGWDEKMNAFEKYDETVLTRIEYNLTDKSFGEHYGAKHPTTTEDENFVIKSLDEYITLARNIVAKNIGCKSNDKKLVLKK